MDIEPESAQMSSSGYDIRNGPNYERSVAASGGGGASQNVKAYPVPDQMVQTTLRQFLSDTNQTLVEISNQLDSIAEVLHRDLHREDDNQTAMQAEPRTPTVLETAENSARRAMEIQRRLYELIQVLGG